MNRLFPICALFFIVACSSEPPPLVAPDANQSVDASGTPCDACAVDTKRCADSNVQLCVKLATGCTAWSIAKACDDVKACSSSSFTCEFPNVAPTFTTPFPSSVGELGPSVDSVLWNGNEALVSLNYSNGSARLAALGRFSTQGLIGAITPTKLSAQQTALFEIGSQQYLHAADWQGTAKIAAVGTDLSLGATSNAALLVSKVPQYGQYPAATGLGTFAFVSSQFVGSEMSTPIGPGRYGFFRAGAGMNWTTTKTGSSYFKADAVAAPTTSGGALVASFNQSSSTLTVEEYDGTGSLLKTKANPLSLSSRDEWSNPVGLAGLLNVNGSYILAWAFTPKKGPPVPADWGLHLTRIAADGSVTGDTRVNFNLSDETAHDEDRDFTVIGVEPNAFIALFRGVIALRIDFDGNVVNKLNVAPSHAAGRYANGSVFACWGLGAPTPADQRGVACTVSPF